MTKDATIDHGPKDPDALQRFPILAGLQADARASLLPLLLRRRMRRRARLDGAILDDRVALIWSGRYRLMSEGRSGRRTNLMTLLPGHIAGIERLGGAGSSPNAWLLADEAGIILTMTHKHFVAIADAHPTLWRAIALANGSSALSATQRLHRIAADSVRERVAAYLREHSFVDAPSKRSLAPRRVDIAADIGASREAVTRVMRVLANEGVA